jgi:hypothetical protein
VHSVRLVVATNQIEEQIRVSHQFHSNAFLLSLVSWSDTSIIRSHTLLLVVTIIIRGES